MHYLENEKTYRILVYTLKYLVKAFLIYLIIYFVIVVEKLGRMGMAFEFVGLLIILNLELIILYALIHAIKRKLSETKEEKL